MDRETRCFQPCARGNHQACARAYFGRQADEMGSYEARIVCSCVCHRQGALFAPASRQGGLFERTKLTR